MIFCVVLLAVFLQLNQGFPANTLDKTSEKLPSFIINGKYAKTGEFPHQLALVMARGSALFCGAALIGPTQAITAAHCVDQMKASEIKVLAGVVDIDKERLKKTSGQSVYVKKRVIHPMFNRSINKNHDLAILTFETPLKLNKNVQPIAWNQDKNVTFAGEKCVLSGWGDTLFGLSDHLKKVENDIITNEKCLLVSHDKTIKSSNICAYTIRSGACIGDSGGPLTCRHNGRPILAGVTSFVYTDNITKKCKPNLPSVYSRLSEYKNFIQDNLEN